MRLTTVLIIASLMQVSAASFGQLVTLNEKNASLKTLLQQIRKQSGYDIIYTAGMMPKDQRTSVSLKDASIDQALSGVLKGTELTYVINEKVVTIKKKEEPSFLDRVKTYFAAIDVRGRVVDEQGQPIPGATVKSKDSNRGVITDAKGNFVLKDVNPDELLLITYIGYNPKEIKAKEELNDVVLSLATNQLDEAVVIAYGQTTQRNSLGNVASVKGTNIAKSPVTNVLQALSGRVPGLYINQANGFSGGGVSVRIQGENSFTQNSDPLYVVDGVPYPSQLLESISETLGYSGDRNRGGRPGNPLAYLNPNDIESVSVLKDAAATAIYGSRAANGAIIITTKRGKPGEMKVDISLQHGVSKMTRTIELMNTAQYLEMMREGMKNDNRKPTSTQYALNGTWDTTRNTNWQKDLLDNNAQFSNLNVGISGGNSTTQYTIGSTLNRQTTLFSNNLADKRASIHFNLRSNSKNERFTFEVGGNYGISNNEIPNSELTPFALTAAPNAPRLYNDDGTLNWHPNSAGRSTFNNPMANLEAKYGRKTKNLIANGSLSYKILDQLSTSVRFGYNALEGDEIVISPLTRLRPELRPDNSPSGTFGTSSQTSWIVEPQINYSEQFSLHRIDVVIGGTLQQNSNRSAFYYGLGYINDANITDILSASTYAFFGSLQSEYRYNGIFGRVNYSFADKYLLEGSIRRDGSSRFGPQNRFNNFWALAGGWIFSNEGFFKDVSWLSFGKLKSSYGVTGNDQIGDYTFLNQYYPVPTEVLYRGQIGLNPVGLYNPNLQWEETEKWSSTLELGFFKDRLHLSGTYYRNRSSNLLKEEPLGSQAGATAVYINFPGVIQNTGFEGVISSTNVQSKSFRWTSSINISAGKNKLVYFPDLENSNYSYLKIGQSPAIRQIYAFRGVNPETGLYQVLSADGKLTSEPTNADRIINFDPNPNFFGGFENTFSYKNFELSTLFSFVKKKAINNFVGYYLPGTGVSNQTVDQLDRWQKPGDHATHQKFGSNGTTTPYYAAVDSDVSYSDASFIRLKNASISWNMPAELSNKAGLKSLRIFCQGQNLMTFTKYKGLDPETPAQYAGLPPLRTFVFGLQASL